MTDVFGYPPERVRVVPNGVIDPTEGATGEGPPAELTLREASDGPRIIQIGSLEERKGPDLLVRAVSLLRDEGVDVRLWLVGDGPERQTLERLVLAHGLTGRVLLTGARPDAASLLAHADIAVLASQREGMPLSLLEAAAWGRAIVTTTVDGCPEIVEGGRAGVLVPPGDVGALARELKALVDDPDRRIRLGERARTVYERRHRAAAMVQSTFACYGTLAESWSR